MHMHAAGAIQRFSLGFRGPLCLVCGFTGVAPSKFALGAAVGALGTMPLQILVVSSLYDVWQLYCHECTFCEILFHCRSHSQQARVCDCLPSMRPYDVQKVCTIVDCA